MQTDLARPNIVLILVDDMGFSDLGCYGSEIETPHLDRLATGGLRFSQFYNCARCCPTRASLLTGLYPHQAGVGQMVGNLGHPSYQGYLNHRCVTIAELLRTAGYRTFMSGKWHVGSDYPPHRPDAWTRHAGDATHPLPIQRGFDAHYGTLGGAGSFFEPPALIHNDRFILPEALPEDYYLTDALGAHGAQMIASGDTTKPFFLYCAHTAPHWPLHAPEATIAKYRGRYLGGWDRLREARYESLLASSLLDSRWPLSPRDPAAPPWEEAAHREWQDHRMAVYAAQIEHMDRAVGRVIAQVESLGQMDNTLFLFLSDNGGCAEFLREDGELNSWPGHFAVPLRNGERTVVGNIPDKPPGAADTFMSYDLPWSNVSNAPFRRHKCWTHEGGISTPLIAHWPAGIPEPGLRHQPGHVVDIMATCLEAAGASYPKTHDGRDITPLEGESLLPAFSGQPWSRQRPIFFEHQGSAAIRDRDWKLVRATTSFGPNRAHGPWELYNMADDRTELTDLAGAHPPEAERLLKQYDNWCQHAGVVDFLTL
ncbi:MAG: arylsulfatase [Opitutales bacterium]